MVSPGRGVICISGSSLFEEALIKLLRTVFSEGITFPELLPIEPWTQAVLCSFIGSGSGDVWERTGTLSTDVEREQRLRLPATLKSFKFFSQKLSNKLRMSGLYRDQVIHGDPGYHLRKTQKNSLDLVACEIGLSMCRDLGSWDLEWEWFYLE